MRFWLRAILIVVATIATFYGLPAVLFAAGVRAPIALILDALVVFVGGNGALYLALRCPRCRKWACRLPRGRCRLARLPLPVLRCAVLSVAIGARSPTAV